MQKHGIIVLGLTGSMAMGKSFAVKQLRALDVPVFESDNVVHLLYQKPQVIEAVAAIVPESLIEGKIERSIVAAAIARDRALLPKLNALLHPMVREKAQDFIDAERDLGADMLVLDIPLLYETGRDAICDYVAVVSAPKTVQYWRLLRRARFSPSKLLRLLALLAAQMPDREKRQRADYIVKTHFGAKSSLRRWQDIVADIRAKN